MSAMISVVPPQPIAFSAASLPFIIAAFQGLILAVVLCFSRSAFEGSRYANALLSALLLSLSVLLADYVADVTGHYYFAHYLMETSAPIPFLIGPLLWGYVKVQTSPTPLNFRLPHLLHLIPALLQLLIVLPFLLNVDSDAKILFYYESWFDLPPFEATNSGSSCAWYQPWQWSECTVTLMQITDQPELNLHLKTPLALIWLSDFSAVTLWISLIIYIGLGVVLLKRHQSRLRQLTSNTHHKDLRWLLFFIALLAFAAVVFIVISFQELFLEFAWLEHDTRVYLTYILIATSVIYLGVLAIRQPVIYTDDLRIVDLVHATASGGSSENGNQTTNVEPQPFVSEDDDLPKIELQSSKYQNSALTPDSTREIRARLENRLEECRDYLDPDLSLKSLAERLDIGPHILSQVINESIGMNFYDCINDYRLRDVKQALRSNTGKQILQIALDCGFNSKSSFYSFFKKREDMTPSTWRKMYDK